VLMVPKEDVGGSEIHEMNILPGQSERNSNDSGALAVSTDQDPDPEIPPVISKDEGARLSIFPSPSHFKSNNQC